MASLSENGQAGANETPKGYFESKTQIIRAVVTDDMMHAGVVEAIRCDEESVNRFDAVCRIYAAMRRLEGHSCHPRSFHSET